MRHQINRLGEKVFCGLIFLPQEVQYLLVSVLNAGHIYLKIIILETHRDLDWWYGSHHVITVARKYKWAPLIPMNSGINPFINTTSGYYEEN